eukprot:gene3452-6101_t
MTSEFIGYIEITNDFRIVEFEEPKNTFGLFSNSLKKPLVLQAEYTEDRMDWMKNLNNLLNKEKEEEKIIKRENDEISKIPIQEYIGKSEKYLFELNTKYNNLKLNLNDICKSLNEKHKNCLKLQDDVFYYKNETHSSLLLRILKNEETYIKFLHFCITLKSEEACSKFWHESEDFKQHSKFDSKEKIKKEANRIYKKYIKNNNSSTALNINKTLIEEVENNLNEPNPNMFDHLQNEMIYLMKENTWNLFVKSEIGRAVINSLYN